MGSATEKRHGFVEVQEAWGIIITRSADLNFKYCSGELHRFPYYRRKLQNSK